MSGTIQGICALLEAAASGEAASAACAATTTRTIAKLASAIAAREPETACALVIRGASPDPAEHRPISEFMISGIITWIVCLEKAFGEPAAEVPIRPRPRRRAYH